MKQVIIALIRYYQALRFLFPATCKFYPSCSEYAQEALSKHRFFQAIKLVVWRIIRCHPLSRGGIDLVP